MKKWLLATRPWSFTASVIPLTLGAALAWASDAAHAGAVPAHASGRRRDPDGHNMLNIYEDYRSGVDTEASAYGESPILLGLISPKPCGAASSPCARPWPWASCSGSPAAGQSCLRPRGDCGRLRLHQRLLAVQIPCLWPDYGVPAHGAAHGASRLLHSGRVPDLRPILAALPVACLVASIMHANDIRDIAHDREAGITTLAMLLGRRKALYLYAALCIGAYGVLPLLVAFGIVPLSGLLPFVLAPGLYRTLRARRRPAFP
ncbi:MAG: prenyltransferase [Bilophila sp.]